MTRFDAQFERLVDATPEQAFDVWNDATARVNWHKPDGRWIVEASTDLRVGGRWRVAFGPSPGEMTVEEGVYEVVDRPHRVVYTCRHRIPGREEFVTRTTVTFEPRGSQTLVILVDAGFPDIEQRRHFDDGWPAFLDSFARSAAAL